jgi:hypothetical protein
MPEPLFLSELAPEISQGDVFDGVMIVDPLEGPNPRLARVILLTNDCDIGKKSHRPVHVVELKEMASLTGPAQSIAGDIRADRVPSALLVEARLPIPESFVDFRTITRLPQSAVMDAPERRMVSMSGDGRVALFYRLYTYFRRVQQPREPGKRGRAPKVLPITPETDRP